MNKYKDPSEKIDDENQNNQQETPIPQEKPQKENEKDKEVEYPEIYKKEDRIWIGSKRHTIMWKSHATALFLAIFLLYLAIKLSAYFIFLLIIPVIISFLKIREIRRNTFEITNKRLKMKVFKNKRF